MREAQRKAEKSMFSVLPFLGGGRDLVSFSDLQIWAGDVGPRLFWLSRQEKTEKEERQLRDSRGDQLVNGSGTLLGIGSQESQREATSLEGSLQKDTPTLSSQIGTLPPKCSRTFLPGPEAPQKHLPRWAPSSIGKLGSHCNLLECHFRAVAAVSALKSVSPLCIRACAPCDLTAPWRAAIVI